jgi:hypothetical protein
MKGRTYRHDLFSAFILRSSTFILQKKGSNNRMSSQVITFNFSSQSQADADGVHTLKLPFGITVVGVTVCAEAFTGSPTGFNIDLQKDAIDVITAVAANSAGTPGEWKSTHFGGSNTPVAVAAGSVIEIDVNLTAGTTPTADYDITIFALAGTV